MRVYGKLCTHAVRRFSRGRRRQKPEFYPDATTTIRTDPRRSRREPSQGEPSCNHRHFRKLRDSRSMPRCPRIVVNFKCSNLLSTEMFEWPEGKQRKLNVRRTQWFDRQREKSSFAITFKQNFAIFRKTFAFRKTSVTTRDHVEHGVIACKFFNEYLYCSYTKDKTKTE